MNRGKMFEEDFFKSFSGYPEISIDRVNDNMGGYAGVSGFCDFNIYKYPNLFHLELKSTEAKSLSFDALTRHQFSGLLDKSQIPGICAGIVVEWHNDRSLFHAVYYLDIREWAFLKTTEDRKSLTLEHCMDKGIALLGWKKVTRYRYEILPWLQQISAVKKP